LRDRPHIPRHPGRRRRSGIACRMWRYSPPSLWGRAREGGAGALLVPVRRCTPLSNSPPQGGRGFPALLSSDVSSSLPVIPGLDPGIHAFNDAGRTTWVAGPSPAMTSRVSSGWCQRAMANSQHLWARSRWAPSLSGIEGGADGGPARGCMRLMEEPGGRFAHGFFRRTGDAGSVTARGGDRKVSGGLDPIPSQRHTAWASRHTHLRIGTRTGPCLLPHCDASRARPSSGADLAQGYSRGWDCCQEQSENITQAHCSSPSWPGLSRPSRCEERRASCHRDHRHEAGDDVEGDGRGE